MAREFTRRVTVTSAGIPVGRNPTASVGTDLIPVDSTPEPPAANQPSLVTPTFLTRQQLIEQYGSAIGAAMWESVAAERRKTAERFQTMQSRLSEIRAQIAAAEAGAEPRLQQLRQEMDDRYTEYLAASARLDKARAMLGSETAALLHESGELIKALNQPMHADRVRQWTPTTDDRQVPR